MPAADWSCAIIGCGPMGAAAARLLATGAVDGGHRAPARLVLIDQDADRVSRLAAELQPAAGRLTLDPQVGDALSPVLAASLHGVDVLISALSWVQALPLTEYAIEHGLPIAGVGRPPGHPRRELTDPGRATMVAAAGLEPGLSEILARRLARGFDPGVRLRLFCGGVPQRPRPPMNHVSWYGPQLTITARPTYQLLDHQLVQVPRFSGLESVTVPGLGILEAFHDGLLPWIVDDPVLGKASCLIEKSLRWPGYSATVRRLDELGLLSELPVQTAAGPVVPRTVLDAVLQPHIERRAEDADLSVLAVEASGTIDGLPAERSTTVQASGGPGGQLTGMGLLTGGVLAGAARELAASTADQPLGILQAHELFDGERAEVLLAGLRAAGARIEDRDGPWLTAGRSDQVLAHDVDQLG